MTKDEALKLALKALEQYAEYEGETRAANEAITAIKEALAQPEQEQFALKHRIAELEGAVIGLQAQRTWVGLTDEEIDALHIEVKVQLMGTFDTKDIYRAIEAKLKEKNT